MFTIKRTIAFTALLATSLFGAQAQTIVLKTVPQGISGAYTTNSTSFVPVDSTNLAYTVTIPTGDKLLINTTGAASLTGANDVYISLYDGSTPLVGTYVYSLSAYNPWALTWVVNGDGKSHNIMLKYKSASSKYTASIPYDTVLTDGSMVAPAMTFLLSPSE